jgi:hypothetical protein
MIASMIAKPFVAYKKSGRKIVFDRFFDNLDNNPNPKKLEMTHVLG